MAARDPFAALDVPGPEDEGEIEGEKEGAEQGRAQQDGCRDHSPDPVSLPPRIWAPRAHGCNPSRFDVERPLTLGRNQCSRWRGARNEKSRMPPGRRHAASHSPLGALSIWIRSGFRYQADPA